jgi:hypothetical protein
LFFCFVLFNAIPRHCVFPHHLYIHILILIFCSWKMDVFGSDALNCVYLFYIIMIEETYNVPVFILWILTEINEWCIKCSLLSTESKNLRISSIWMVKVNVDFNSKATVFLCNVNVGYCKQLWRLCCRWTRILCNHFIQCANSLLNLEYGHKSRYIIQTHGFYARHKTVMRVALFVRYLYVFVDM